MNDRDLMYLPAHEQRQMVLDGQISSVELIEASLRRIAELDPQLNAFVTLDADGARSAAAESDRKLAAGQNPGLLHGIPICVKDLELTNGLRTTLGCAAFADWVPDFDSAVVERLRGAGAVILGKTNTPEFGNSAETFTDIFPTANNPWDITRHPGGSSGGTSAAIASGMCSLGTGSDGGGSVRLPASFTNIFGHKPTHGRTPRYGGRSMPSYNCTSTSGPMSQDVRSSAIMHMAISGHDSRDPGSLQSPVPDCLAELEDGIEGMKIGFSMDLGYAYANDDVARVTEKALNGLEDAGATVTTADISFDPVPATYWWTIWTAGQVAMYGHLAEDPNVELTDYTMEMVNAGYEVTGADYASALRQAEVHRIQVGTALRRVRSVSYADDRDRGLATSSNTDGNWRTRVGRGYRQPVRDTVLRALEHLVEPGRFGAVWFQRQWDAAGFADNRAGKRRSNRVQSVTSLRVGKAVDIGTTFGLLRPAKGPGDERKL